MFDAARATRRSSTTNPPRPAGARSPRRHAAPAGRGEGAAAADPACAPRPARDLDTPEHRAAIEAALAELRPRLKADGGDCELVGVEGDVVRVRMTGACAGCQLASMTVLGVRMKLIEKLGFPVKVVPI